MKPSVEQAPAPIREVRRKGFHSLQQTKGKNFTRREKKAKWGGGVWKVVEALILRIP